MYLDGCSSINLFVVCESECECNVKICRIEEPKKEERNKKIRKGIRNENKRKEKPQEGKPWEYGGALAT